MYKVNTEKTKSMNIDGVEFIAEQPIVGVSDERLNELGLIERGLVILVEDDEAQIKGSEILKNKNMAGVETLAGASGISTTNPAGLTDDQLELKRKTEQEERERAEAEKAETEAKKKAEAEAEAKRKAEAEAAKKKAEADAKNKGAQPNVVRGG